MTRPPHTTFDDWLKAPPAYDFFVGIDSDGCVFDTMETKQRLCFHPLIIDQWKLQPIAAQVRRAAEFINLYSRWRGQNRYLNLMRVMDLLRNELPSPASATLIPACEDLRAWITSGRPLSMATLRAATDGGSRELAAVLAWSERVDRQIAQLPIAPVFAWAAESLEMIRRHSDCVVVSQTPLADLVREWSGAGLSQAVRAIAGQEIGAKEIQLQSATQGRYRRGQTLMIGDAPGDAQAALASSAMFYPILPGSEAASWERFFKEAFDRFITGRFAGAYADELARAFYERLPTEPPWNP